MHVDGLDADVVAEAERVASGGADGDQVKLHQLHKQYPGAKQKMAGLDEGLLSFSLRILVHMENPHRCSKFQ